MEAHVGEGFLRRCAGLDVLDVAGEQILSVRADDGDEKRGFAREQVVEGLLGCVGAACDFCGGGALVAALEEDASSYVEDAFAVGGVERWTTTLGLGGR